VAGGEWKVLLSPPEVGDVERELLVGAFDSGWIAPAGPDLAAFEAELCELTGVRAVAALSSGTAALHLALLAVGVSAGDDVLVSTLTFGATAFAATYLGARPCFVDAEERTWHMDPDLLAEELAARARRGELPGAVVAVDLYGSVVDAARLQHACDEFEVPLVIDAAESLGATRDGIAAAHRGKVAILSFNGNKIVTTGGGGAIASDDLELVDRARFLATQARRPVPWYEHDEIGFNYRMGNLNAAVGRGQLRTLRDRITERARVRTRYEEHLGVLPGARFQDVPSGVSPNHWLTTVRLDPAGGLAPAIGLAALRDAGIEARWGWKPMHRQPVFAGHPTTGGSIADELFASCLTLPSGSRLTDDDVEWICSVLLDAARS